jgi:hypothetical protein
MDKEDADMDKEDEGLQWGRITNSVMDKKDAEVQWGRISGWDG